MSEIASVPSVTPSVRARSASADASDGQPDASDGGGSSVARHDRSAAPRNRMSAAQISPAEIARPVRIFFSTRLGARRVYHCLDWMMAAFPLGHGHRDRRRPGSCARDVIRFRRRYRVRSALIDYGRAGERPPTAAALLSGAAEKTSTTF
jgi:hypothetical protein